jgi:hypothetical protein
MFLVAGFGGLIFFESVGDARLVRFIKDPNNGEVDANRPLGVYAPSNYFGE